MMKFAFKIISIDQRINLLNIYDYFQQRRKWIRQTRNWEEQSKISGPCRPRRWSISWYPDLKVILRSQQFRKILKFCFYILAETKKGKLSVGKIYAGLLILESWKTTRFGKIESAQVRPLFNCLYWTFIKIFQFW